MIVIDMVGVNAMLVAASLTGALGSVLYFVFIRDERTIPVTEKGRQNGKAADM